MPLYQWGQIAFEVMPMNVHEVEESAKMEFAKKEILGTQPPREATGEDDQEMVLRGRLYPHKIGGLDEFEAFQLLTRKGLAQNMTRGDGRVLGWFQCLQVHKVSTYLRRDGIGQVINFEAQFMKAPVPGGDEYFASLYSLGSR
jgi:phage protein U